MVGLLNALFLLYKNRGCVGIAWGWFWWFMVIYCLVFIWKVADRATRMNVGGVLVLFAAVQGPSACWVHCWIWGFHSGFALRCNDINPLVAHYFMRQGIEWRPWGCEALRCGGCLLRDSHPWRSEAPGLTVWRMWWQCGCLANMMVVLCELTEAKGLNAQWMA